MLPQARQLSTAPDRLRLAAARLLLLIATLVLPLVGFELALRWHPSLLGISFAEAVLSKYHSRPGGIYYRDPAVMNMRFMLPSFETDMDSGRYRWHHKTDALGFRYEVVYDPVDVVLLGDSFIYGHGLEFDQTVGYSLAQSTG